MIAVKLILEYIDDTPISIHLSKHSNGAVNSVYVAMEWRGPRFP